jgi:glycosyltransferase involved in cell wall biosynthesis
VRLTDRKTATSVGGNDNLGKINVLHILTSLGIGGIEKLFVSMAEHWSKDKYNVSVCLINSYTKREMVYYDDLMQHGLKVYLIGKKRRGSVDLKMPYNLFRLLRKLNIHIVHTHNISSEVYSRIAGMIAHTPIIIFHEHGAPTELQLKSRFLDLLLRKPDMIIAVSDDTKKMLKEKLKISQDKIQVIYNGIKAGSRHVHFNEGNTIFTVSRLVPEKGLKYLIDALILVKKKIRGVKLFIIGDGPSRKDLEIQTTKNGLTDTIFFLGFQQFPEKHYEKYDIFVLPSLEEGFGLALIEAMSYGKPAIATRVGGIPEIIEDGINGILVSPKDHKALANALIDLLSDKSLRKKLARKGQLRSQLFTVNTMVNEIEALYKRLIKLKIDLTYDEKNNNWRHT